MSYDVDTLTQISLFTGYGGFELGLTLASVETRTVCCKLLTTRISAEALFETSVAFSAACNSVLKVALETKTKSAISLQKLCYVKVRELFGLSANLSIRAIRRVAGCMTRLKGRRKKPKLFTPKSIDYDARIFSYRQSDTTVSLTTTSGRIRFPMILGEYQRKSLAGQTPTSATVINKAGIWYIHIVIKNEAAVYEGNEVMGIDLGIKNIATSSTGLRIEEKGRQRFKEKKAKVRASLQSKGTRGAKKVLKKNSGRERRKIRHENHVLSKQLVEEAKRHNCGTIRMERLKSIRDRTKTWNKHLNRMISGRCFY